MRSSLVVAILTLTAAASAQASVILDQEHTFTSSFADSTSGNVGEIGQTFTVGVAGTLDHINVLMFRLSGSAFDPTADPQLNLYNTSAGVAVGLPLFSVLAPKASVPLAFATLVTFDVSAAALSVNVGDVLAFGITTASETGPYFLPVDGDTGAADDYAAGNSVIRFPPGAWQSQAAQDHGFETYVNAVPEPSSFILSALGILGIACLARRRK